MKILFALSALSLFNVSAAKAEYVCTPQCIDYFANGTCRDVTPLCREQSEAPACEPRCIDYSSSGFCRDFSTDHCE